MVAMKLFVMPYSPIASKAELTVRLPGARIAPASNTRTWCQTRFENSGSNGEIICIIRVGRVRIDHLSLGGLVTSVPYPFHLKWLKSS
jgi:hypothetical protein